MSLTPLLIACLVVWGIASSISIASAGVGSYSYVHRAVQQLLDLWETRTGVKIDRTTMRWPDFILPRSLHERIMPAEPGREAMLAALWTVPSDDHALLAAHNRYERRRALVFALIVGFGAVASIVGGIGLAIAVINSQSS